MNLFLPGSLRLTGVFLFIGRTFAFFIEAAAVKSARNCGTLTAPPYIARTFAHKLGVVIPVKTGIQSFQQLTGFPLTRE